MCVIKSREDGPWAPPTLPPDFHTLTTDKSSASNPSELPFKVPSFGQTQCSKWAGTQLSVGQRGKSA